MQLLCLSYIQMPLSSTISPLYHLAHMLPWSCSSKIFPQPWPCSSHLIHLLFSNRDRPNQANPHEFPRNPQLHIKYLAISIGIHGVQRRGVAVPSFSRSTCYSSPTSQSPTVSSPASSSTTPPSTLLPQVPPPSAASSHICRLYTKAVSDEIRRVGTRKITTIEILDRTSHSCT